MTRPQRNDAEQLTSVTPPGQTPTSYTWDANGSLTDRGSDEFSWDYEDRMTESTVDGVTTTFEYRGDGLRDSRTVGGNTTTFTWDIAADIPVVLDDGTFRYVYGAHGLIAQKDGTDDYYLLGDGQGSTMAITDGTGTVVREYEYDVFGEVTGGSGSVDSEFQFAGEQVNGSTGLQYLRNRYYDMETGRFISRDPLADNPGWLQGSYSYVGSNPVTLTDPLGLCIGPVGCPGIDDLKDLARGGLDWLEETSDGLLDGLIGVGGNLWNSVRAGVNAPLSGWALGVAASLGGQCQRRSDGISICLGVSESLFDSLGARAVTIGNVILTKEKTIADLGEDLIKHEVRHADQWAIAGLSTPGAPLAGQAGFAASYAAAQALFGTCGNPFEILAGIGDESGVRRSCG